MASTAGIMRLVEPYFETGRTVYGDSAFGSVNTAIKLKKNGLFFFGMVKTAHKFFPKGYFNSLDIALRTGTSVYLNSFKDDVLLHAVAWWDKRVKHFVSTAGTNLPAGNHRRLRYRLVGDGGYESFEKSTPISAIPFEYFSYAQKIDVHNHRRQGILAIERCIATRNWAFRIVSTVLGIIMVDAYMLYLHDRAFFSFYESEKNLRRVCCCSLICTCY